MLEKTECQFRVITKKKKNKPLRIQKKTYGGRGGDTRLSFIKQNVSPGLIVRIYNTMLIRFLKAKQIVIISHNSPSQIAPRKYHVSPFM